MRRYFHPIFLVLASAALLYGSGCGNAVQGLRFRAQFPSIDEAFSKLALAIEADGYETEVKDPERRTIVTAWRPLKVNEYSDEERAAGDSVFARIELQVAPRGSLYDVFLTPSIGVAGKQRVPGAGHPLTEKWTRILNTLLRKEAREEG